MVNERRGSYKIYGKERREEYFRRRGLNMKQNGNKKGKENNKNENEKGKDK